MYDAPNKKKRNDVLGQTTHCVYQNASHTITPHPVEPEWLPLGCLTLILVFCHTRDQKKV